MKRNASPLVSAAVDSFLLIKLVLFYGRHLDVGNKKIVPETIMEDFFLNEQHGGVAVRVPSHYNRSSSGPSLQSSVSSHQKARIVPGTVLKNVL